VNNHRSIPPITSASPPRRSSITEQQTMSIPPQSLNLTKSIPIHHNDNSDVQSPRHIDEKSDETKVNPEFSLLFH